MVERYIRLALFYALCLVFLAQTCFGVAYTGNPVLDIFCHGNMWHLWLCCFAFWMMLRGYPWPSWKLLAFGFACACIGAVLSPWPVQGTSGILCAVMGVQLAYRPTKNNIYMVAFSLAFCTLINYRSAVVHLLPFSLGILTAIIVRRYGRKLA